MKKWMKKMAIIGAVLFVGGIGVTSIGAAIGGAAAGLDFLIDQEKIFQDKYNWKAFGGNIWMIRSSCRKRSTSRMRWKSSWTEKNNANSFPENGHTLSTQGGKEYFLWMKIRWILRK